MGVVTGPHLFNGRHPDNRQEPRLPGKQRSEPLPLCTGGGDDIENAPADIRNIDEIVKAVTRRVAW